jgi:hypothetical protein
MTATEQLPASDVPHPVGRPAPLMSSHTGSTPA